MNRHPRFWHGGIRQAVTGFAMLLVPGLAPDVTAARSRQREWRQPESPPYLVTTGPPALRFRGPEILPEPALRPVAIGPPIPGLNAEETKVAAANHAALRPPSGDEKPRAVPKGDQGLPPANEAPPAILPDDTRPVIKAEDFLPFFQVPGAGAPAPSAGLPPSSATYTQSR